MTREEWRTIGAQRACRDCGESFLAHSPNAKYCERCAAKRQSAQSAKNKRRQAEIYKGLGVGCITADSGMPPYADADTRYELAPGVTLPPEKPISDMKPIPYFAKPGERKRA